MEHITYWTVPLKIGNEHKSLSNDKVGVGNFVEEGTEIKYKFYYEELTRRYLPFIQ